MSQYTAVEINDENLESDIPLDTFSRAPKKARRGRTRAVSANYSQSKLSPELNWSGPWQKQMFAVARNPFFMITLLAGLLVLIVVASINNRQEVLEPKSEGQKEPPRNLNTLSLTEVGWALSPSYGKIRWVIADADGSYSQIDVDGNIVLVHVDNTEVIPLALAKDILDEKDQQMPFTDYYISSDQKYLLLETRYAKGWRHSFFADYYLFNTATKTTKPLTTSKSNKVIPEEPGSGRVALAMWSPMGHVLAWVRDNDLYVTLDGEKEVQITYDGSKSIINGIADWVYEEEVYRTHHALWFSPDGSRIAYLKFNETLVPDYRVEYYMTPDASYPREVTIKYPKAGTPNPVVTLHIATPTAPEHGRDQLVVFNDADNFPDEERLIVEVTWMEEAALLVRLMNRVQDHQRVYVVKPVVDSGSETWVATLVRDEPSPDRAWFNVLQAVTLIPPNPTAGRNAVSYIELAENQHGFMHISYYRGLEETKPTTWLTSGNFEVTEVLTFDSDTSSLYFMSTEEGSTQRHLYSLQLDGSQKLKLTPPKNFTSRFVFQPFNITAPDDDDIGYYSAEFSPRAKYYNLKYMGPGIPFSKIYKTDDGKLATSLATNDPLHERLLKKDLPRQGITTILNENGDEMNTKIIVPPDFDDSGATKYPVIMKVYGGPNSQSVSHEFSIDFMSVMAGSLGFISVIVDGRGTGAKGRKFRSSVSENLGHYEVIDQVTAAKHLASLPFVDEKRIGIWGWSYGGYLSAKVIEADSGIFALGMSVAPVTHWKYYDSIYTERYMKTPKINPNGYDKSSVKDMNGFKHAKFLLVHGTADDNVHFQNTAALIWKLTGDAVRNYRVQVFTDSDHSIYANGANAEVFNLLKQFLEDNFINPRNETINEVPAALIPPVIEENHTE